MKIGIFPGSFNPVHIGHLALANYLAEYEKFDKILFVITPYTELKNKIILIDKNLRLKYLNQSIQGYKKFETSIIEWSLNPPFYTINTLQKLQQHYPSYSFELIIGADNGIYFHLWKDYQIILKWFRVLIYPRKGYKFVNLNCYPNIFFCRNAPQIDISSSFIRKSIAIGKEVRFYLPKGIYDEMIHTNEIANSQ